MGVVGSVQTVTATAADTFASTDTNTDADTFTDTDTDTFTDAAPTVVMPLRPPLDRQTH